jgi:hypothetical protein
MGSCVPTTSAASSIYYHSNTRYYGSN